MSDLLEGKYIILCKVIKKIHNVRSDEEVYKWMLFELTLTIERNKRNIKFQKQY